MKKRADGRFQKRITLENGKSKLLYSSANSEREAVKDFNRQMLALETEHIKSMNFDRVAEAWADERFPTLQNNTLKQYYPCKNEAVSFFMDAPIAEISAMRIKSYLDMLANKGFAKKNHKRTLRRLKTDFHICLRNGVYRKNPCATVKLKFSKDMATAKRQAATTEEEHIIKSVPNDVPFAFFAKFLLFTGCRRGEALALTPKDIDFENKKVTINKTVEWLGNKPQIKHQPKTAAGNREIPLPDVLLIELKKREKQSYIFQNNKGNLFDNSQITRGWNKLKKEICINCTPHQLRHSYATMLFDAGIDVKTAQKWLGHTDIKTTLDIYTHLSETRQAQAADKWFNYIEKVVNK